ncbi:MAG: hypothetical protein L3K03_03785 [Thermoplasmata archaeon]|nr:hypothetical protein [Thermoplasmata archaeon]
MPMKDNIMICDSCGATITSVTSLPAEGYPKLHALCSKCFAAAAALP